MMVVMKVEVVGMVVMKEVEVVVVMKVEEVIRVPIRRRNDSNRHKRGERIGSTHGIPIQKSFICFWLAPSSTRSSETFGSLPNAIETK